MSDVQIQGSWLDAFETVIGLCAIKAGDSICVLSETQSRPVLVALAELAAQRRGARVFNIKLTSGAQTSPIPIRSTGASIAIGQLSPVVHALAGSTLVLDCTVEGLLHAPELPQILKGGARVLMVSNEHPEILERLVPKPEDEAPVRDAMRRLREAKKMTVQSAAGTDLVIDLQSEGQKSPVGGVWGWAAKPGQIAHWPGGLVLAFPRANSVNGRLVLDRGDINLAFKDYLRDAVRLEVRNDYIQSIAGAFEAERLRSTWDSWERLEGAPHCKAVSHCGWGLNPRARWDSLSYYDKSDCNGTELRAFGGNFLYSTGANETAGRHTLGHFDLPIRGCTIAIDGQVMVNAGVLAS